MTKSIKTQGRYAGSGAKTAKRCRLTLGNLPPKLRRARGEVGKYQKSLEDACEDAHGEVSLVHAHTIHAAALHHQHLVVARHVFKTNEKDLTPKETIEIAEVMAKAATKRNAEVAKLQLDHANQDALAAFYCPTPLLEHEETPQIESKAPSIDPNDSGHAFTSDHTTTTKGALDEPSGAQEETDG